MSVVLEKTHNSDNGGANMNQSNVLDQLNHNGPKYLKYGMNPLSRKACINAASGVPYYNHVTNKPIIIGSKASEQLFIVTNSMGLTESKDPVILYYDSPEQYERHRHTTLVKTLKDTWHAKIASLGYTNNINQASDGVQINTVIMG
jgi:hypothetical protein